MKHDPLDDFLRHNQSWLKPLEIVGSIVDPAMAPFLAGTQAGADAKSGGLVKGLEAAAIADAARSLPGIGKAVGNVAGDALGQAGDVGGLAGQVAGAVGAPFAASAASQALTPTPKAPGNPTFGATGKAPAFGGGGAGPGNNAVVSSSPDVYPWKMSQAQAAPQNTPAPGMQSAPQAGQNFIAGTPQGGA